MNFSFLRHETAKLRPQRITVKSSEVSWPPLLAVSCIMNIYATIRQVCVFIRFCKKSEKLKRRHLNNGTTTSIMKDIVAEF